MSFMQLPKFVNIIPVKDKKPLVSWKEFTEREQTAIEKQRVIDLGHNLGIVTGRISKILVLDDDGGLDVKTHQVPKTWTAKTPRGGTHYYFKWVSELDNKITTKVEVLPKVDTRGDGGYVVFYGFERPYFTTPLANPPQWLVNLLPNKQEEQSTGNAIVKLEEAEEGNRNERLFKAASSLRARGLKTEEIYTVLKPKAEELNYPDDELKTLCESAGRYKPRGLEPTNGLSIEEFLKDTEKVEWIVPGIVAKKSIGFVAGLPETGKTWMLMDLAIEVAKPLKGVEQRLWLNKIPVEHGKVLFIDQERFKGETQRRFRSVLSAKALDGKMLKSELFIRCGTSTRLDLQHSYDAFHKEISEIRPDLVIVDSFATFHTREENNRKDIQEVLERVKQIRTEFGCTFLFIHHENKYAFNKDGDQEPSISQMAGSIAIPAACETVLTVRKQDAESSMVYHTKSTLSSTVPPFLIKVTDENEEKTKIRVEAF